MDYYFTDKLKFFSQYFLSEAIWKHKDIGDNEELVWTAKNLDSLDSKDYLFLKSIYNISDEDALTVARIIDTELIDVEVNITKTKPSNYTLIMKVGDWMTQVAISYERICSNVFAYQYLLEKGYALPHKNVSIEQQIEKGWIKLIE